jgi:hypothetical protein
MLKLSAFRRVCCVANEPHAAEIIAVQKREMTVKVQDGPCFVGLESSDERSSSARRCSWSSGLWFRIFFSEGMPNMLDGFGERCVRWVGCR